MPIVVAPATLFAPSLPVQETVYGDSTGATTSATLGQRFIYASDGNTVFGDAKEIAGRGRGGDDVFQIADANELWTDQVCGDAELLRAWAHGGDDRITTAGSPGYIRMSGDAVWLREAAIGGDDYLEGGAMTVLAGDASDGIRGSARGGDDRIVIRWTGYGDTEGSLFDQARGGDDVMFARGAGASPTGDAGHLRGTSRGGNDTIYTNDNYSQAFGDALYVRDRAVSGDDFLHAKKGLCELYGDALELLDSGVGGNDVLSGSSGDDTILGDAASLLDRSRGGNDVLLGGRGDDRLFGDAGYRDWTTVGGSDRFVFAGASGRDTIYDFQPGKDVIDVRALGFRDINELAIEVSGERSIVHFDSRNQVTVWGTTALASEDFLFA